MYKKLILILFLVGLSTSLYSQRVSISTDVTKWATLSPNMSVDLTLSSRLSLNVEGVFDPFIEGFKRTGASFELRYWLKRPMYGHYLGFNTGATVYDLQLNNRRFRGQALMAGVGYGYSFIVSKRVSLTPNIGIGYGYVSSFTKPEMNHLSPIENKFRPLVTRLGVSFSYIIN